MDQKRRTTSPALRTQRSAGAARGEGAPPARNHRIFALVLAAIGVGLGVYVLAPRSGADRIRVRRPVERSLGGEALAQASQASDADGLTGTAAPPSPTGAESLGATQPEAEQPAASGASATAEVSPESLVFGEPSVPNGRTFALRMSGPVQGLEGESRENGFTVRVPGRLALDRASPIATSHRAVARAMILNRGDYAELTIDFLPGKRPKYQVQGKEATLEVTLERL